VGETGRRFRRLGDRGRHRGRRDLLPHRVRVIVRHEHAKVDVLRPRVPPRRQTDGVDVSRNLTISLDETEVELTLGGYEAAIEMAMAVALPSDATARAETIANRDQMVASLTALRDKVLNATTWSGA
jgi:hypothetical protein